MRLLSLAFCCTENWEWRKGALAYTDLAQLPPIPNPEIWGGGTWHGDSLPLLSLLSSPPRSHQIVEGWGWEEGLLQQSPGRHA